MSRQDELEEEADALYGNMSPDVPPPPRRRKDSKPDEIEDAGGRTNVAFADGEPDYIEGGGSPSVASARTAVTNLEGDQNGDNTNEE